MILPDHDPLRRVLLPVALGKVLRFRRAAAEAGAWQQAVADACYAVRVRELATDGVQGPDDAVISLIFRRWLETTADEVPVYDLRRLDDRDVIRAATGRLL